MAITTQMVKELREATGAGVLDCKNALEETNGDFEKAAQALRVKGLAAAAKKAQREASEGLIESYIHTGGKLGVLVEVNCETDFVARTEEFTSLCHEIAMQIAATAPEWVSRDDIPADVIEGEKKAYLSEFEGQNKPTHILERILDGKLSKFYEERCLLEQEYIRDDSKTVQELVTEAVAKLGENIVIRRFVRFQVG